MKAISTQKSNPKLRMLTIHLILQMTLLKTKMKNRSKKPLKGKRMREDVAEGGGTTSSKPTEYTGEKAAETKIPKPGKATGIW